MKVSVCIGSACHLRGSYDVITALNALISERELEDEVELAGVFCLGHCLEAVSVQIGDDIFSVNAETVSQFFEDQILPRL